MQGLQVWDENGNIVIDTTTKTSTLLGRMVINQSVHTFTDPALSQGNFYYILAPVNHPYSRRFSVSKSGNTVTINANLPQIIILNL